MVAMVQDIDSTPGTEARLRAVRSLEVRVQTIQAVIEEQKQPYQTMIPYKVVLALVMACAPYGGHVLSEKCE